MKRAILIVFSVLAFLVSVPAIIGGIVLAAVGANGGDIDFRLGQVETSGSAVVSDAINPYWDGPFADRFDPTIVAENGDSDQAIFMGLGPTTEVDQYLSGVPQTLVYGLGGDWGKRDVEVPGTLSPAPPGTQDFWVAQISGTGEQRLALPALDGSYRFAVMNADGSPGVTAAISATVSIPFLTPIGIGSIVFGVMLLLLAILLLVLGIRAKPDAAAPMPSAPVLPGYPGTTGSYPGTTGSYPGSTSGASAPAPPYPGMHSPQGPAPTDPPPEP